MSQPHSHRAPIQHRLLPWRVSTTSTTAQPVPSVKVTERVDDLAWQVAALSDAMVIVLARLDRLETPWYRRLWRWLRG